MRRTRVPPLRERTKPGREYDMMGEGEDGERVAVVSISERRIVCKG